MKTPAGRLRLGIVHTAGSACRCHGALRAAARRLGHAALVIACEHIDAARQKLSACDLVFEVADTFRGAAERRPGLRFLLERWGCRLAGTPAAEAEAADDKVRAHRVLEAAGVPMARWRRGTARGLGWPVVVKEPFVHGSAGVRVVQDAAAWRRARPGRLTLVEEFVEGRELALAGIEQRGRVRWLPAVEVDVTPADVYSYGQKWGDRPPRKRPASLPAAQRRELERLAGLAWKALGLRHYARFDVRLRPNGDFCFLEANVRPSVEPGCELRRAAQWAGLRWPELAARIIAAALQDRATARRSRTWAP